MVGALLTAVLLVLVASSSLVLASCLRFERLSSYVLAAYLVGWAEVVVSAVVLSLGEALQRGPLLVASAAWLALAVVARRLANGPRPPSLRPRIAWLGGVLRDPLVLSLAIAVVVIFGYVAAIGLFTPQNDADALVYHLTRAALWKQHHAVGWIESTSEPRIDGNPVVAEIGQSTTMIFAGTERFVWLGQWLAALALGLGSFALARAFCLPGREAVFGALAVLLLPMVVVQSFTAYNDLVVASFLLAATVFALGERRSDLVFVSLAVALAVGTKFTAPLGIPLVAVVALLGRPRRAWPGLLGAGLVGIAIGAGWFAVNLAQTGKLDGGLADAGEQSPVRTVPVILFNLQAQLLDLLELPAVHGADIWLYPLAGIALAALLRWRARMTVGRSLAGGALVALVPVVVFGLGYGTSSVLAALWRARGETGFAQLLEDWEPSRWADGLATAFGPIAAVVLACTAVATALLWRRHRLPAAALGAAAAPFLGIALIVVAVSDDPWRWRFLAAAVAMSASLWGLVLRIRWLAAAVVASTLVTALLVVVGLGGKPSGLRLLEGNRPASVWTMPRWQAQTLLRTLPFTRPENATVRWFEENVPHRASVGLALRYNDLTFPYLGSRLERSLTLLSPRARAGRGLDWLVAAPGARPLGCASAWQLAVAPGEGWRVWHRVGGDTCATPVPLTT